jgi:tRNA threonylcarbamoyladenosine biosynthesis protein TsaE
VTEPSSTRKTTTRRIAARLLLSTCAAIGAGSLASAHPDIRIEDRVIFLFDGARVSAIEETWTFDPDYSQSLLADYDADHDGRISPAESRKIAEHILPNLAEIRYFTYLWVDGRDLATLPPRDFVASAENGLVTFRFVIDLPSPIDPQRQVLKVEINDRDYSVEIRLAKKDPVELRAPRDLTCVPRVRDDVENAYLGYVSPQEITLSCR